MEITRSASYSPDPAYLSLSGPPFYDPVEAARFPAATLRFRNERWAARIGLENLSDEDWARHFAGFEPLPDNIPEPLALRYHGHQFRIYNPDIGDGRGFLYAQVRDADGRLLDLATKGSGKTPYSRTADGRLTLKGAVREILATEMLEALGVYTSKTFSVIETGEALERHDEPSPTRSAALVRLGHSHVRFGTFQRLGFENDADAIRRLIDYCVAQFDPDLAPLDADARPAALFSRIVARTARLAAQWMAAGFVHGVLNTDNMNVTGESFDYGPWRFLPQTDFSFTAAYFDHQGLYAFGRQPDAAAWNLSRLGGVFSLVIDEAPLNDALQTFAAHFQREMATAFFARLGVEPPADHVGDAGEGAFGFVVDLLKWMESIGAPFEQVLFDWFGGAASTDRAARSPVSALYDDDDFAPVRERLVKFTSRAGDRLSHAYFKRAAPCTMLIEEVEAIWAPIADNDDWSALREKLAAIAEMRDAYGFDASTFVRRPGADD